MSSLVTGFRRSHDGRVQLGGVFLGSFLDEHKIPTPVFVYDLDAISAGAARLVEALGAANVVAYAVKANSAGTILRAVAASGTGADVVSGAELELALRCGVSPDMIVMSGVAKSDAELDLAIARGIFAIQAEGVEELDRLAARAQAASRPARVALRINPGVKIDAHAHVATGHDRAKFGILRADLPEAWEKIDNSPWLEATGLSTHIGSTLTTPEAYLEGARIVCDAALARRASKGALRYVNFGGGFGIDYGKGAVPEPAEFASAARRLLSERGLEDHRLLIEPGRCLVGAHGVLVADVIQVKQAPHLRWLLLNAGMNDLLRPALYQARHRIEPIDEPPSGAPWQVAGPVCESTDDFGEHLVSDPPPRRVVVRDAGAYGFVMSSEYNGRALPAEVFIAGGQLVKRSESSSTQRWIESRLSA
jgi:diaminopimelate decarboxylase